MAIDAALIYIVRDQGGRLVTDFITWALDGDTHVTAPSPEKTPISLEEFQLHK
jgi:hypothetical protein